MTEELNNKARETISAAKDMAKEQIDILKTKEGRDALKEKAKGGITTAMAIIKEEIVTLKTNEGREAFVVKTKERAIRAKTKMVSTWKSGSKGKAIIIVAVLAIMWLLFPSCNSNKEDAATISKGSGHKEMSAFSAKALAKVGDFKKIQDSDELFFEGHKNEEFGDFMEVKPNLIKLPDFISEASLLDAVSNGKAKEKGVAFADREGYQFKVKFVGKGYVVIATATYEYAYIKTQVEYLTDSTLQEGLYLYYGNETVPLANGSSKTMRAFKQLDDNLFQKYMKAWEYNNKAKQAAEEENARRSNEAYEIRQEKAEAEAPAKEAKLRADIDKIFRDRIKAYDENGWKKKVHYSRSVRNKVAIELVGKWIWGLDSLDFQGFKKKLETDGGAKYVESIKGSLWLLTVDDVKENLERYISPVYSYKISCSDPSCKYNVCYIVSDGNGGINRKNLTTYNRYGDSEFGNNIGDFYDIYVFDEEKDAEIKSAWEKGTERSMAKFRDGFSK